MNKTFNKIIKSHLLLSVLTVIAVILVSGTVTYALFQVENKNAANQVISIGNLDASLTSTSGAITITDIYPKSVTDLEENENTYSFTVTNTGDYTLSYELYLTDNTSSVSTSYPNYKVLSSSYYQYIDYRLNGGEVNNLGSIYNSSTGKMTLIQGTINPQESKEYTIQFWLDNGDTTSGAPNDINGSVLALNINLDGTAIMSPSEKTLAALDLTAKSGTPDFTNTSPGLTEFTDTQFSESQYSQMMNSYARRYYTYADSYTFNTSTGTYTLVNPKVGQYSSICSRLSGKYIVSTSGSTSSSTASYTNLSTIYQVQSSTTSSRLYYKKSTKTANLTDESETGIWSMADDYGTSYYFRGNVTNNYVNFAGFYWRIIRINGDGSIRMIYDGTQAYTNGTSDTARYVIIKAFNSSYNNNTYVGYMYGSTSGTYAEVHANTNSSTIKTYLEDTWYKTNIVDAGYSQYISDEIFCNDRSLSSGDGIGTNHTEYGAYNRLYTNKTPQLTCPQKNDAFTVDDTTKGNGALKYPVGLITADEIVLAGGKSYASDGSSNNTSYYLYKGNGYWSLSPLDFDANNMYAGVFLVSTAGGLDNLSVDMPGGVAPVINLSAEYALQMTGSGTASAPFTLATGQ